MSNSPHKTNRHPIRAFLFSPFFAAIAFLSTDRAIMNQLAITFSDGAHLELAAGASMLLLAAMIVMWLVMIVFAAPLYLVLRWLHFEYAVLTILLAAGIAAFFYALPDLLWYGEPSSSFRYGDCQIMEQGIRTECGWSRFWLGAAHYGVIGLIGGVAFWRIYAGAWVWRLQAPSRRCSICA